MIKARWTRQAKRTALGGVLCLAALMAFAQGAARAGDDDEEGEPNSIWNLDKRIWDSVVKGIGLKSPNDTDIEYRERSPLVVPPNRNLPPPEQAGSNRTAAWPVDPDKVRREAAKTRKKSNVNRADDEDYQSRALLPSEVDAKGGGTVQTPKQGDGNNSNPNGRNESPSELGYFGGLFSNGLWGSGNKDETATFTTEPPRTSLTAPPVGYRTPSQAQPYGVSKDRTKAKATPMDPAVGSLGQ